MGFDPMCVTTKRVLKKLGGDKISGKTLTFDGNLEGRNVIDSEFGKIVKISDDVCNFDATIYITYIHGNRTGGSDRFEVQTSGGISAVAVDGTIYAIRFGEDYEELCGTYFLYHSDTHYATKIALAETIVPIDPKFLPKDRIVIDLKKYGINFNSLAELASVEFPPSLINDILTGLGFENGDFEGKLITLKHNFIAIDFTFFTMYQNEGTNIYSWSTAVLDTSTMRPAVAVFSIAEGDTAVFGLLPLVMDLGE